MLDFGSGQALVDATIPIQRDNVQYSLTIRSVRTMGYFLDPRTSWLETYKLEWARAGDDHFQSLCRCEGGTTHEWIGCFHVAAGSSGYRAIVLSSAIAVS